MKKLLLILLAFLAVFTYIRAIDIVEAGEISQAKSVEITQ